MNQQFVAQMWPHALRVSQRTGLDPRLVVAQSALETGWGRAAPGNNYFGIKSHGKPGGQTFATHEIVNGQRVNINDSFRAYDGMGASADGYAEFLERNPRYRGLLSADGFENQVNALAASGYATDPNYGSKIRQIASRIDPSQFAGRAVANDAMQAVGRAPVSREPVMAANRGGSNMPQNGLSGGGQPRAAMSTSGSMGGMSAQEKEKWYKRPEIWEALQLGFNSMRLNPDQNLAGVVGQSRAQRQKQAEQEAERAQQAEMANETMQYLSQLGTPQALQAVDLLQRGIIDGQSAVQMGLAQPDDNRTSLQQNFEYARSLGMSDDEARAWASSAPQTNVNVNTGAGEVGTIPPGFELMTDPETGARSMQPIPGGPAAQEAAANVESRERQQTLTDRQISPTIDDIVTARDLAETGIGRTGMMSGILRRVPVLGQGALDLGETIDAIGAGISLENLNQMRQASPTGGALGNVSDRQSTLLSSAFGSLQQSQSKELFLYNLARVENTLNDIVHGAGNGPERHDMADLRRRYLGGREPEATQPRQQQAQPEQPAAPPQVGEVVDGYRFMGGDPANPNSWQKVQ